MRGRFAARRKGTTSANFAYDAVGNRLAQTKTTGGTINYAYDERDRLLQEGPHAYTWDDNGNLVSKSAEATYTWTTTTAWSASSRRTTSAATTSSPSSARTSCGGWQTRFYHSDYIGSVRKLTDETGNITDGYTYSAFGELLAHSGSDPQPYAFTGEPLDPTSGWQYHRARWMDPSVGRFAGMDRFRGANEEPRSLHDSSYAEGDPLRLADRRVSSRQASWWPQL